MAETRGHEGPPESLRKIQTVLQTMRWLTLPSPAQSHFVSSLRTQMKTNLISPLDARICKACENLVTTDLRCPLCDAVTKPHPESKEATQYCCACGNGPLPAKDMHLVTWNEDPYTQTEDGDLICHCGVCAAT